jgi:hypothetical protein
MTDPIVLLVTSKLLMMRKRSSIIIDHHGSSKLTLYTREGYEARSRLFQGLGTTCHSSGRAYYCLHFDIYLDEFEHKTKAMTVSENNPSVNAWQKALDSLPKGNLTPAELKQRDQYSAGLKEAKRPRIIRMSGIAEKAPWQCAAAMKPELIERKYEAVNSSVSIG